eukprot:4162532-Pyramimonas_sp.AAC.1
MEVVHQGGGRRGPGARELEDPIAPSGRCERRRPTPTSSIFTPSSAVSPPPPMPHRARAREGKSAV